MKLFGILFLLAGAAFAQDSTPYGPELAREIKKLSSVGYTLDGQQALHIARATYDVAINGGSTGSTHGLGVFLPAGSIIKKSYYQIVTQFVDVGTGTVALKCEDAGNLLTAADITSYGPGVIKDGNQTGGVDSMSTGIAAECEISANNATTVPTAGKLILFVEYLIGSY